MAQKRKNSNSKRPKNSKKVKESSTNMENTLECDVYTQDVSVLPASSTSSVVNNIADTNDDNGEAADDDNVLINYASYLIVL